jgi:hypothetical protein
MVTRVCDADFESVLSSSCAHVVVVAGGCRDDLDGRLNVLMGNAFMSASSVVMSMR